MNKTLDKWVLNRTLTARQGEVTEYMICGYTNAQIAEELGVSKNTVATHAKNILERVGVTNRRKLATLCFAGSEQLTEHLELSDGWPTALSFTLRSSTQPLDERNDHANTSSLIYRYVAEQVYSTLSERERELLSFAALMPHIDLSVLQHAGYDDAPDSIEDLRNRAAFIIPDKTQRGIYHCHDLFRNFIRYQIGFENGAALKATHAKVGSAYEAAGEFASALYQYSDAKDTTAILRILDDHGFALLEEANGHIVARAIDVLNPAVRAKTAMPLALRGLLEASAGRYDQAESYLKRAANRAHDPEQRAQMLIPVARIAANRGNPDLKVLKDIENDKRVSAETRALALGIALNVQLHLGEVEGAAEKIDQVVAASTKASSPMVRAHLLRFAGAAAVEVGDHLLARELLNSVAEFASVAGLHSIASKAFASLAIDLGLFHHDATRHLSFAQQALVAAAMGGEKFDLQISSLLLFVAEVRRGNSQQVSFLERQLSQLQIDPSRLADISMGLATRNGWEGNFEAAYRVMSTTWEKNSWVADRGVAGGYCAIYAAASGRMDHAKTLVKQVTNLVDRELSPVTQVPMTALYGDIAMLFCALAEAIAGRQTSAKRILKRQLAMELEYVVRLKHLITYAVRAIKSKAVEPEEIVCDIEALQQHGFGSYGMLVQTVIERFAAQ